MNFRHSLDLLQGILPDIFESSFTWGNVKVDIGMSFNAPMTINWLSHEEGLVVLGFEPDKRNFSKIANLSCSTFFSDDLIILKIQENIAIIFRMALSSDQSVRWRRLYQTIIDSGGSSLHKPLAFEYAEQKELVETWNLDSILRCQPFNSIDLIHHIKIDTQGHDLQVCLGALDALERTLVLTAEVYVGKDYEVVQGVSQQLEMLVFELGFSRYQYFSIRKKLSRILRFKIINLPLQMVRNSLRDNQALRIAEVPDQPFFLFKKYFSNHDWIRVSDPTFINHKLRRERRNDFLRIFQRG